MSMILNRYTTTMIVGDTYEECYKDMIRFITNVCNYKICVLNRYSASDRKNSDVFVSPTEYIFNNNPAFAEFYKAKCEEQRFDWDWDNDGVVDESKPNNELIIKKVDEFTDEMLQDWCNKLEVTIDGIDTIEKMGSPREIYAVKSNGLISKFSIKTANIFTNDKFDETKVGIVLTEQSIN